MSEELIYFPFSPNDFTMITATSRIMTLANSYKYYKTNIATKHRVVRIKLIADIID